MGNKETAGISGWFEKLHNRRGGNAAHNAASYDPARQKPVLHKSICTGETTAGFKDLATGKYTDEMLIRSERDLKQFMDKYGITERPETEY